MPFFDRHLKSIGRPKASFSTAEQRNVSAFFAEASVFFGSQQAAADACGVSQPTVAGIISQKEGFGHKSLVGISRATGIPVDEILSGAGVIRLRARQNPTLDVASELNRLTATRALSILFGVPEEEISSLFTELGTSLPVQVPAETWFDVGRAAIERRRTGHAAVSPVLRKI